MDATQNYIKLTASEVSYLWNTYIADTMSISVFKHFLKNIDDKEIESLITHSLNASQQHIEIIGEIFKKEKIGLPHGFKDQDVHLNAKRLFSDVFYLKYIKQMTQGGLAAYARVLQHVYREDIMSFYSKSLSSTKELNEKAVQLLLEKGLAQRPPVIPYPVEQEFVQKQSFLLEGLGRREELTGTEISQLHFNIQTNQMGSTLATAFSQVVQSEKVRDYLLRGKEIAAKHIKVFSEYFDNASLPIPSSFEQEVTDSIESPFSDKLIMFHFGIMIYAGIGNYGIAISESSRSDLAIDFSRLAGEILKYAEDGMNIMIENGWLEKPPSAANRKDLINK